MTKFKFGDKVWHKGLFGNGIYYKPSYHGSDEPKCYVLSENYGLKVVEVSSITKVSDWIQCSERMPEFNVRVLVVSGNRFSYDFLLDMGTHSEWASLESWDYWMYAPEMPEVKE